MSSKCNKSDEHVNDVLSFFEEFSCQNFDPFNPYFDTSKYFKKEICNVYLKDLEEKNY